MDNLSFEELKALADSVVEDTLLEKISGGTANDCHDDIEIEIEIEPMRCDNI